VRLRSARQTTDTEKVVELPGMKKGWLVIVGMAALAAIGLGILAGCAGEGKSNVSVIVNPNVTTLGTGQTQQFVATVIGSGNRRVEWSVLSGSGTITADGLFTAGSQAGTTTIQAQSVADRNAVGTASIQVAGGGAGITISWEQTDLPVIIPKSRFRLNAIVSGSPNTDVNYSVEGTDAGTITADGVYTAPNRTGTFTVVAKSDQDPTQQVTLEVPVVANARVRWEVEGRGEFVLELRPDEAPNHCANLVSLVNSRFYDGIVMHRYEPGFVIQWGDPQTKTLPLDDPRIGSGGPGYTIDFEANPLQHEKYALGMARSQELNSAGSQVYLCLEPAPSLDGNYVVFGAVETGFAVVDALRRGDKITRATTLPVEN